MIEVDFAERNEQPYLNIGLIISTWADGSSSHGTFSLVGRNDILTAGHCVYDPDSGGWATEFAFYFGADYNSLTGAFDSWVAATDYTQWTAVAWPDQIYTDNDHSTMLQSEAQYDLALIGIDTPIGDTLGWLGLAPGYDGDQSGIAVGYPSDSTGMMRETAFVSSHWFYDLYESSVAVMGPGSSGGPLLVGDYVIGVKSTSNWWADLGNASIYDGLLSARSENDSLIGGASSEFYGRSAADTLTGGSASETFWGLGGNDLIKAGLGNDTLYGGAGNDRLNGMGGADILLGGGGNDTYYVDNTGDRVHETTTTTSTSDAGGSDTVLSYLSAYTLGSFVENGRILSTGTAKLTGNGLNNTIHAGKGNNVLAGGAGIDTVSYAYGANGNTGVKVSLATTSLQTTGGSGTDTISGFERLSGSANSDSLTGNSGANVIRGGNGRDTVSGGSGSDTLYGDAGNDLLRGGTGNDVLFGGAGKDLFRLDAALSASSNVDRFRDFSVLDDTIQLENAIFRSFGSKTGVIGSGNFKANTSGQATDSNDYIVYETDTGKLFYDADGSGGGSAVQIAVVGTLPTLTYADFVLV